MAALAVLAVFDVWTGLAVLGVVAVLAATIVKFLKQRLYNSFFLVFIFWYF